MIDVTQILEAMGPEQWLLAFVFLGSYAFAMGELIDARGRRFAVATALLASVAFVALSDPWEQAVILVALALVGMGVFAAAVWAVWGMATWRERQMARIEMGRAATHPAPARLPGRTLSLTPSRPVPGVPVRPG